MTLIQKRRKGMDFCIHPLDTSLAARKINEKIRFVKENIMIGSYIRIRPLGAPKGEYTFLKLDRIEGKHYIFINKHGWSQAYTMAQLCFDISDGKIKLVKGETNNGKK